MDGQLDATCVGVELENGRNLAVPAGRCLALMVSLLQLGMDGCGSPRGIHQLLGVLQWYDLLRRPKLATYTSCGVYRFVADPVDNRCRPIPPLVMEELICSFLLGIFWKADLTRPFCGDILASDASTDYGLGRTA